MSITTSYWPNDYWPDGYWHGSYWPHAHEEAGPGKKKKPSVIEYYVQAPTPPEQIDPQIIAFLNKAIREYDDGIEKVETVTQTELMEERKATFQRQMQIGRIGAIDRAQLDRDKAEAQRLIKQHHPRMKALEKAREARKQNLDRKAEIKAQRLKNLKKARRVKARKKK